MSHAETSEIPSSTTAAAKLGSTRTRPSNVCESVMEIPRVQVLKVFRHALSDQVRTPSEGTARGAGRPVS
jgi:hypothetical protein